MGMVTMYRYGYIVSVVIRRYIDLLIIIINFPYSTCIVFFWQQHPYFFVHFKKKKFRSCLRYCFTIYVKRYS